MCMVSLPGDKQRWVLTGVNPETVAAIKVLSTSKRQSMSRTVDLAVEYFCRKVVFYKDEPLKWDLPVDW